MTRRAGDLAQHHRPFDVGDFHSAASLAKLSELPVQSLFWPQILIPAEATQRALTATDGAPMVSRLTDGQLYPRRFNAANGLWEYVGTAGPVPAVSTYRAAAGYVIASATTVAVPFDNVSYFNVVQKQLNATTNVFTMPSTSQVAINVPGVYAIAGAVAFSNIGSAWTNGFFDVYLTVAGTTLAEDTRMTMSYYGNTYARCTVSTVVVVTGVQNVDLRFGQDNPGAFALSSEAGAAWGRNSISIVRLGDYRE